VKTRIVRIGNSQGIRIPKPLLSLSGLSGQVEISLEENRLVISTAHKPRSGWAEAFRTMAKLGDDELLDRQNMLRSEWDEKEWDWR